MKPPTLTLTAAQGELIEAYIRVGRYRSTEAVIEAALSLLRRHEPPTEAKPDPDHADINDYLGQFEAPE